MTITILGVDPSLAATGIATCILDDAGVLTALHAECVRTTGADARLHTTRGEDDARRAGEIAASLREAMRMADADVLVVEAPQGSQSARAARASGIVLGLLGALADELPVPVVWLTSFAVKKALTGNNAASKAAIAEAVAGALPDAEGVLSCLTTRVAREAATDALAVCIAARDHDLVRAVMQGRRSAPS